MLGNIAHVGANDNIVCTKWSNSTETWECKVFINIGMYHSDYEMFSFELGGIFILIK